jgi:threonine dehydrogenase-like Zn-dependent dehydrogenase
MGDRVIIPWKIACGHCTACRRGHTAQCSTVPPEDSYSWGPRAHMWGGFVADAVVVPWADHMLTRLPTDVDPIRACGVADNISDGWRAVGPHLAARPGGTVLVTGGLPPGSIGLYAAGLAKSLGAAKAVYASPSAGMNAIAAQMGCEVIDTNFQPLSAIKETFDVTVDSAGDPAGLTQLLRLTGRAGVCTSVVGIVYYGKSIQLPVHEMYRRSVSFHTGWVHTHGLLHEPLELIRNGTFDPRPVNTAVVEWEDAAEALASPFTKIIVHRPM